MYTVTLLTNMAIRIKHVNTEILSTGMGENPTSIGIDQVVLKTYKIYQVHIRTSDSIILWSDPFVFILLVMTALPVKPHISWFVKLNSYYTVLQKKFELKAAYFFFLLHLHWCSRIMKLQFGICNRVHTSRSNWTDFIDGFVTVF